VDAGRRLSAVPDAEEPSEAPLDEVLRQVALGDEGAFEVLYRRVAGQVLGVVQRVVRDPAQSEEVAQEVLVEVWRSATRFDATRGTATTWVLTMAHRRAVDRVRSAQASSNREDRVGRRDQQRPFDEVAEQVTDRLEHEAVRRCLGGLTELQRESVQLAYYGGKTYREVAELLGSPLGTIKTRLRDGLIRLRDCLGVIA
jgi:RNA polymerase sigma-70 factor (ECF subfamily)